MKDLGKKSPTQEVYVNNRDIEWRKKKLEEKRRELESGQLNALRELLPNDVILKICEECQYYFRNRLLSPLVIIFHMMSAAVSREGSFQSAWHLSGQSRQSGSLAKARKRLPLEVWIQLDKWMKGQIETESGDQDRWRGHRMIGVDGTCISMSDEPELAKRFGKRWGRYGFSRFPLGRMLVAFNLKTLISVGHEVDGYTTSELELLGRCLPKLQRGDVLVGDRRYAGVKLYLQYQQAGLEYITRTHHRLQVERLKTIERFTSKDFLVELPMNPESLRRDPSLPKFVRIRVIKTTAKIRGKEETFWLVTSLLDPQQYPATEIQGWYKTRWRVETLIEELKVWLNSDVLRSKTAEGVEKELFARLIALNLIHWLILKAAKQSQKEPDRLSVSATLRLAVSYSLKMSAAPVWQLRSLYEELLHHVGNSDVPYRPDRIEPRMQKREQKRYSKLKIPRSEWKRLYAMAA